MARQDITILAWPAYRDRQLNPYTSLLYAELERLGCTVVEFSWSRALVRRYDVFHVHWPEAVVAFGGVLRASVKALAMFALVAALRARGTSVFWTVHNLRPHDDRHRRLRTRFAHRWSRMVDAYISLTYAAQEEAQQVLPALAKRSAFVIPHGSYKGEYPDTISQGDARVRLGIPEATTVFVSLGLVRRYKNIPALIRSFRQMMDPNLALIIAGGCSDNRLVGEIREAAGSDPRIHLHLTFIARGDVQVYLRGADLVVQPYSNVLNSGSALLALSFERPVLVPRQGSLGELERHFGSDWVLTYDGVLTAQRLAEAGDRAKRVDAGRVAELQRHMDELNWVQIAQSHLEAYKRVVGKPRDESVG
jgi:beta-1,4-mannosyltransferase